MAGFGGRVGLAQQRNQARHAGVGDPGLGTVDQVAAVDRCGDRADRLQVRAAVGFGERHRRPQLTGGHARQVALLLLVGAEPQQQFRHHRVTTEGSRQRHPAAADLLGDLGIAARRHGRFAVRLGDRQPVHAHLLHLLDQRRRIGVGVFEFVDDRAHLVVDPARHQLDDLLLLGAELRHLSRVRARRPSSPSRPLRNSGGSSGMPCMRAATCGPSGSQTWQVPMIRFQPSSLVRSRPEIGFGSPFNLASAARIDQKHCIATGAIASSRRGGVRAAARPAEQLANLVGEPAGDRQPDQVAVVLDDRRARPGGVSLEVDRDVDDLEVRERDLEADQHVMDRHRLGGVGDIQAGRLLVAHAALDQQAVARPCGRRARGTRGRAASRCPRVRAAGSNRSRTSSRPWMYHGGERSAQLEPEPQLDRRHRR